VRGRGEGSSAAIWVGARAFAGTGLRSAMEENMGARGEMPDATWRVAMFESAPSWRGGGFLFDGAVEDCVVLRVAIGAGSIGFHEGLPMLLDEGVEAGYSSCSRVGAKVGSGSGRLPGDDRDGGPSAPARLDSV
jgi:hypothetical protein